MSEVQTPVVLYPGDRASPEEIIELADQYLDAARTTEEIQVVAGKRCTWAPTRFLYIHAIELYLNALLRKKDHTNDDLRTMNHSFKQRLGKADKHGLRLPSQTLKHLGEIEDSNEYISARYGPERLRSLPNPNQLKGSAINVREAVLSALGAAAP